MSQRNAFRFAHPFRVRYAEIDGQGIVFNAHYLTYFDTAITEYLRHLGYDYEAEVKRTGDDFHLVKTTLEYRAPIRFDEEIEVGVRVPRIGRSSLVFELGIFGKGESEPRATGENIWVNTNQTTHETVPVPDRFIDLIRTLEGDALEVGRPG
ncbi:acyl-CoA thioesterase [Minwuia thermotolerans]|uniref:Acyl-CoA thioesterase n=1 Tax=Minwuia thermotolerans TaxID=2056226 RepID=A0A2M9G3R0_9PROT|nr:thioesterase family protein [Minwuia thermotolerans]PJK30316.1 acyl-CoA thioesterase [Minwuia thermotolerans]